METTRIVGLYSATRVHLQIGVAFQAIRTPPKPKHWLTYDPKPEALSAFGATSTHPIDAAMLHGNGNIQDVEPAVA